MLKVQIICENCNSVVELTPQTRGQHADMSEIRDHFRTSEEIDVDISDNLDKDFINKLVQATSDDAVVEILENDIIDNVESDEKLNELRIDCANCGNYIVLNNF